MTTITCQKMSRCRLIGLIGGLWGSLFLGLLLGRTCSTCPFLPMAMHAIDLMNQSITAFCLQAGDINQLVVELFIFISK